jgi:hypothetical protein
MECTTLSVSRSWRITPALLSAFTGMYVAHFAVAGVLRRASLMTLAAI